MEAKINVKADAWRRRIDDQRASGQSVRAWCKERCSRRFLLLVAGQARFVPQQTADFRP